MKTQASRSKLQRVAKLTRKPGKANEVAYPISDNVSWSVEEDRDAAPRHPFDLEERTAIFGERIICFLRRVPLGPNNNRLIDQLTGCGTSIGPNYCEANEGFSKKDFRNIIGRCRKESKETKFFLRMIAASEPTLSSEARTLFVEAKELHLIFCSIYRKTAP